MADTRYYVGLDVGGTTMKAAVVDDEGNASEAVSLPTEPVRGQEFGLERMCETIRKAVKASGRKLADISGIGVATPGTMDLKAGIILDPPNLKPWRNVPVRQYVAEAFKLPTAFQNDANAAAFGEYWVGAGREADSMVMFTLGTGIGGGIVIGDVVLEGQHSHGAELGHTKIEMTNPRLCGCGRLGCLEAYASATAVVARAREAVPRRGSFPTSLAPYCFDPHCDELTAEVIFKHAENGDELAMQVVDETAYYLAMGASNLMHTIDPDIVVFGGGMIAAGESFLDRIRFYVKQIAFPVPAEQTEIRYAQLGNDAGVIGAAGCARQLVRKAGG